MRPDPNTGLELRESLRAHARALGVDDLGFTTAAPLPHAQSLETWLAEGREGEMSYLREHGARHDPERLLPGARSLLVAAFRYARDPEGEAPIAAYAQRPDYHHELRRILHRLADHLRERRPDSRTRVMVDTAPLFEREAAARAGLGWIGRSTMLVHPEFGCFTLLGEVLWTEELPPDPPGADRCGRCRRCVDACPTQAIGDYEMDPRRCLSYWTIEQKGPIPEQHREALGGRAFGCDACIEACPFGRDAVFEEGGLLPTEPSLRRHDLGELLDEAGRRFHKIFGKSPVERARKRGFLRSLLVAVGNRGGAELIGRVEAYLDDDDALLREHAQWALEQLRRRATDEDGAAESRPS